MRTVRTFKELAKELDQLQKPVGFVPTMGYLHQGHRSLVRRAKEENQSVVVSIFPNPTQFAPDEDLNSYPRDIEGDLKLLKKEKTDLVWIPDAGDIYPDNFQTWVNVEDITKKLEGIYRPDHFRGVTTVVAKLFNAVQPDKAYFGQKDAQQVTVIQQMTKDLNYPIEIVVCPTVRELDGLAMSSRNSYLNEKERKAALCLIRGLEKAKETYMQGENNVERIKTIVSDEIKKEDLAELQYVSLADPETLDELSGDIESGLLSLAVFIGKTRLIDNIMLQKNGQ
jgi:pantoate--beta-alanine ligase